MKKIAVTLALVTSAILSLGACGYDDGGVTGKIVDKDRKSSKIGKSTTYKYELDVVDANGVEHEIRVNSWDYNDCFIGSSYPKCKNR